MRPSKRSPEQMRKVSIETNVMANADGSCLIKFGNTHVMCSASIDENVPRFLRNKGAGWVTAEYGMLPASTGSRMRREAANGKQGGRTVEIQRLIGRSLRSMVNFKAMGERQVIVDCDVIQADGGTRTASITGGYVALYLAFEKMLKQRQIKQIPLKGHVAAISCGIYAGNAVCDLDYAEDSNADVDANFIMSDNAKIIEIQGTAEGETFSEEEFLYMMKLAKNSIKELIDLQKQALKIK